MPHWLVPLGAVIFVAVTLVLRRYLPQRAWSHVSGQAARYQIMPAPKKPEAPGARALSSPSPSAEAVLQREEQLSLRQRAFRASRASIRGLSALWTKINNDWVLNLAAMLAYNLLMSIVPILAMLLSFFGLFLDRKSTRLNSSH